MTLPPITAVVTTYFPPGEDGIRREAIVERTLASWREHLVYDGHWYPYHADDGSADAPYDALHSWFYDQKWTCVWSRQERRGVGASLNAGFAYASERSPLVLYAVDDWALDAPLDLTPWARLLLEREDIGMVRLGPPHPNLTGKVEHLGELGWCLRLDPFSGIACAQRPALYHRRMVDAYGPFDEDRSALECERLYNERLRVIDGPAVVLALPHPWRHVASIELADIDPRSEHSPRVLA